MQKLQYELAKLLKSQIDSVKKTIVHWGNLSNVKNKFVMVQSRSKIGIPGSSKQEAWQDYFKDDKKDKAGEQKTIAPILSVSFRSHEIRNAKRSHDQQTKTEHEAQDEDQCGQEGNKSNSAW